MVLEAIQLHQRGRIDTLGDLTPEQQIEATGFDDRVEGRIRNEVIDAFGHHGQGDTSLESKEIHRNF